MEMSIEELFNSGKRFCYYISPTQQATEDGYVPSLVFEGVSGYFPLNGRGKGATPWFWGKTLKEAEETASIANEKLGVSEMEAMKIIASSMFIGA